MGTGIGFWGDLLWATMPINRTIASPGISKNSEPSSVSQRSSCFLSAQLIPVWQTATLPPPNPSLVLVAEIASVSSISVFGHSLEPIGMSV